MYNAVYYTYNMFMYINHLVLWTKLWNATYVYSC